MNKHDWDLGSIDIYLNAKCNLSCTTCFLGDSYFTGDSMSVAAVQAIVNWSARRGVKDIALLGGEPTMHPDVGRVIEITREAGIASVRLVSNGGPSCRTFLHSRSSSLLDSLYLSIDGPSANIHDQIRGPGSFSHLIKSFRMARAALINTVATTTINSLNAPYVKQTIQLARTLGAKRVNIHWMSATGRAAGSTQVLDAAAWSEVLAQISDVPTGEEFTVDVQQAFLPSSGPFGFNQSAPDTACAVRDRTNLQFMPSGAVHACGLTVDDASRSAYVWTGQDVVDRLGATELKQCWSFTGAGCPIRSAAGEGAVGGEPVCIYLRQNDVHLEPGVSGDRE